MEIYLELDGQGEMYRQVHRALRRAIAQGRLVAGARLPSTRALANQLGVARNTILTAYELLCAEHLAVSRVGSGTYIQRQGLRPRMEAVPRSVKPPSAYAARLRETDTRWILEDRPVARFNLQYGSPVVDMGLFTAWGRALAHAAERTDAGYPPTQGLLALRQEVAAYLGRRRGLPCSPDDIVIVNGTQQALSLLARLLIDEGDQVALEDPSFKLVRNAFAAHGARLAYVPVDRDGLRPDRLPTEAFKLLYTTPSHQYPSGARLSLDRRRTLIDAAAERDFWIVEDDYDGEFGQPGTLQPALSALDPHGRAIYVGTFSKVLLPSIRLGFIVVPPALKDDLLKAKLLLDIASSGIDQAALASFMKTGAFERHLRQAAAELRRRRRALVEGVNRWCSGEVKLDDTGAGMHCVAWLPEFQRSETLRLVELARSLSVAIQSIHTQYRAHAPPSEGLLLGFASVSPAQIREALRRLGECIDTVLAERSSAQVRA